MILIYVCIYNDEENIKKKEEKYVEVRGDGGSVYLRRDFAD